MTTLHPTHNDVRALIAVKIADAQLATDPGFSVNQIGNPVHPFFGPIELEPIHHRARIPHRTSVVVRPVSLPRHNVFQSVAVHIVQSHRMELGEKDAVRTFFWLFTHDQMFDERRLVSLTCLLVPCQPESVRLQTGDDIVVTIAIDIISKHVAPPCPGKRKGMQRPERSPFE